MVSKTKGATAVRRKQCGTCTLCCKLLAVQEINKPAATSCHHCDEGRGCKIYSARPTQCRLFNCYFLTNDKLGEAWRPSKSKIVVVITPDGRRIGAHVDPERPGAWRREPFYSKLKAWSREALAAPGQLGQVLVSIGKHTIVILPDRNVDLGEVESDELVITEGRPTPSGTVLQAFKIKRDDPRAQHILNEIAGAQNGPVFRLS
jgi:hypothetical protein